MCADSEIHRVDGRVDGKNEHEQSWRSKTCVACAVDGICSRERTRTKVVKSDYGDARAVIRVRLTSSVGVVVGLRNEPTVSWWKWWKSIKQRDADRPQPVRSTNKWYAERKRR